MENWCWRHARHVFAGLYVTHVKRNNALGKNSRLVVSFTEGERGRIRWLRRHLDLDRPNRLVGSPRHPRYPLIYLEHLAFHIPRYHGLVNGVIIEEAANIDLVETERVKKVRSLLRHRYGRKAPIRVIFGKGPVLARRTAHGDVPPQSGRLLAR
jgi:hypothetical protein